MGDTVTYYHRNGEVKARGDAIDEKMEGEWSFYREDGQLWQVGNFRNNEKHGRWIRYDHEGEVEDDEEYEGGHLVKNDK